MNGQQEVTRRIEAGVRPVKEVAMGLSNNRTSPALPGAKNGNRNIFPGEPFVTVPLRLYDSGLAPHLSGAAFKRYISLLRAANFNYGQAKVKLNLQELAMLDGVSSRTARNVDAKLQELGLIQIDKGTRPYTYRIIHPDLWDLPDFKKPEFHRADRLRVKLEFGPIRPKKEQH